MISETTLIQLVTKRMQVKRGHHYYAVIIYMSLHSNKSKKILNALSKSWGITLSSSHQILCMQYSSQQLKHE